MTVGAEQIEAIMRREATRIARLRLNSFAAAQEISRTATLLALDYRALLARVIFAEEAVKADDCCPV